MTHFETSNFQLFEKIPEGRRDGKFQSFKNFQNNLTKNKNLYKLFEMAKTRCKKTTAKAQQSKSFTFNIQEIRKEKQKRVSARKANEKRTKQTQKTQTKNKTKSTFVGT